MPHRARKSGQFLKSKPTIAKIDGLTGYRHHKGDDYRSVEFDDSIRYQATLSRNSAKAPNFRGYCEKQDQNARIRINQKLEGGNQSYPFRILVNFHLLRCPTGQFEEKDVSGAQIISRCYVVSGFPRRFFGLHASVQGWWVIKE